MKKIKCYWLLCGVIFLIGMGIAAFSAEFPDATDSGEMPLAFGAGVNIAALAVVGFAVGIIIKCILAVIRNRRH